MKKYSAFILALILVVSGLTVFAESEKTQLSWWVGEASMDNCDAQLAVAEAFMDENPDVEITINPAGVIAEYQKKIVMMAASDSLPDLFQNTAANTQGFAQAGALTDITAYVDADEEWTGYYNPGAWNAHTEVTGGIKCGSPWQTEAQGFFYNKKLFDAQNLEIPTTWEEFTNAVKVFAQAGVTPIVHGGSDVWACWGYYPFFSRYGLEAKLDGLRSGELKWTDEMIRPFERIEELHKLGAYPVNVTTMDNTQAKESFLAGQAAMYTVGTWEMEAFAASPNADDFVFNWGPTFADSEYPQQVGIKSMHWSVWLGSCVGKDEKKLDAARRLLKFLASPSTTKMLVEQYSHFPATKYDTSESQLPGIYVAMFKALADEYQPCSETPFYFDAALQEPIWNAITSVITGTITPLEAAGQLDDAQEMILGY